MFSFDFDKLTVHNEKLETVSRATVNPKICFRSNPKGKEEVPFSNARSIIQNLDGCNRPLYDVPVKVIRYEGKIVCAAVPKQKEVRKQEGYVERWHEYFDRNIVHLKKEVNHVWKFDGTYLYIRTLGIENRCDKFGLVHYRTFDLTKLDNVPGNFLSSGKVGFQCKFGDIVKTTGPLMNSDSQFMQKLGKDKTVVGTDFLIPSLRFVIYAARTLSAVEFDYQSLEPLGIPLAMIEHSTFNLSDLPMNVQETHAAPFLFDEAIFWLCGLITDDMTQPKFNAVHACINMLTSKGHILNTQRGDDQLQSHIEQMRQYFSDKPCVDLFCEAA